MTLVVAEKNDVCDTALNLDSLQKYCEETPGLKEELSNPEFVAAYEQVLADIHASYYEDCLNCARQGLVYSTMLSLIHKHLSRKFPVFSQLYLQNNDKSDPAISYKSPLKNQFIADFFKLWEETYGIHGFIEMGYGAGVGPQLRAVVTGDMKPGGELSGELIQAQNVLLSEEELNHTYAHLIEKLLSSSELKDQALSTSTINQLPFVSLIKQLGNGLRSAGQEESFVNQKLAAIFPNSPLLLEVFTGDIQFRREYIAAYENNRLNAILQYVEFGEYTPAQRSITEKSRQRLQQLLRFLGGLFIGQSRQKQIENIQNQITRLQNIVAHYAPGQLNKIRLADGQLVNIYVKDMSNPFTKEGIVSVDIFSIPNLTPRVEIPIQTFYIDLLEASIRSELKNSNTKVKALSFEEVLDLIEHNGSDRKVAA